MTGIHEEHEKTRISNRRLIVIFSIQIFLFLVLIIRLTYLQIISYDKYVGMSEDNRIKTFVIPPLRGHILDRNNIKLTENQKNYRVLFYQSKNSNNNVIKKLSEILSLSDNEVSKIVKKLDKNKDQPIVSIVDNVDWEDLIKIEANSYMLDGISIENGYIRYYPYSTTFSHVIGYVNSPIKEEIDNEKELKNKELLLSPDYKIGRSGMEKLFNSNITGKNGFKKLEVNALSVPIREISVKPSTEGKNIKLTIDYNLQKFVEDRMKGLEGAVIVMNVRTGEILAMVSTPTFDGNKFVEGVSSEYWEELNNNPAKPLNNKAVSATYPPGSTFKLITAISALENGWSEDKEIECRGKLYLNKSRTLHCWKKEGHGIINMVQAIKYSCNIYFSRVGLFTGIENIYKTAIDFGIGENFDIDLLNKKVGNVPNKDWKRKVFNDVWVTGDTINVSIGQGFLTVTPLELVVMVARIANGGYKVEPFIISNSPTADKNKEVFLSQPIVSQQTINTVKKGMYGVINDKDGTAYWSRIKEKGFEMSGKTGTAQVIAKEKLEEMEENYEEVETKFKHHALFVAFAPYEDPKYAISVVVEHGNSGSGAAAPVARDVLLFAQKNNIGFEQTEK
ncbi:MAG TPA: penicillin-binding protein 2 [Rickettsiales bacterium]|nr:penicillin-binding protein 2 [Rickettsiales bacterium]